MAVTELWIALRTPIASVWLSRSSASSLIRLVWLWRFSIYAMRSYCMTSKPRMKEVPRTIRTMSSKRVLRLTAQR